MNNWIALLGLFIVSLIYLIQSAIRCSETCPGTTGYAVAVGTVSCVVCVINVCAEHFTSDNADKMNIVFAIFLILWWIPGTGVGTFDGPYANGCDYLNGFVSAWAALMFSVYNLFVVVEIARRYGEKAQNLDSNKALLVILAITSLFYIIASAIRCGDGPECTGYEIYAIVVGVVGVFLVVGMFILSRKKSDLCKYISVFAVVWWGVGTAVGTFKGPFGNLTNGYICAWGSLISSAIFAAMTGSIPDISHQVRYGPNNGNLAESHTGDSELGEGMNPVSHQNSDAISDPTPRYNPPMGSEQL